MRIIDWWHNLSDPGRAGIGLIVAIIGVIVGVLLDIGPLGGASGDPSSDNPLEQAEPAESPGSLLEQIEQSDLWVEPPRIFETADDDFRLPGGNETTVATVSRGDVIAFTPEELADQAVRYEGDPVYVVGRAADVRAVPSDFGLSDEVRLVSDDGSVAFVGTGLFFEAEGTVVFALGRVAAVGKTRLPSGRIVDAAYLVAFSPSTGGGYDIESVDLDSPFPPEVSPSIIDAARRVAGE